MVDSHLFAATKGHHILNITVINFKKVFELENLKHPTYYSPFMADCQLLFSHTTKTVKFFLSLLFSCRNTEKLNSRIIGWALTSLEPLTCA